MEKNSFQNEMDVSQRFHKLCYWAMKRSAINYYRYSEYLKEHEIPFSDLSEKEMNKLYTLDEYAAENYLFQVLHYDVYVRDALIAEALGHLTKRKREVILLSFFMDMNDREIAKALRVVQSTIHVHKKRSLELLKNILEEKYNEKEN